VTTNNNGVTNPPPPRATGTSGIVTNSPVTKPPSVGDGNDFGVGLRGLAKTKHCFETDHCLEWKITGNSIQLTLTARAGYVSAGFNVGNPTLAMSPADVVGCWRDNDGKKHVHGYTNVREHLASVRTDVGLYELKSVEKNDGLLKCVVTRPLKVPTDVVDKVRCNAVGKQDIGDFDLGIIFAWGNLPAKGNLALPQHTPSERAAVTLNLLTGGGSTAMTQFGYTLILASGLWIALLVYGLVVRYVMARTPSLRHRCIGSKIHNSTKSCLRNIALSQAIALVFILVYLIALPFILTALTGKFETIISSSTDCDASSSGASTVATTASSADVQTSSQPDLMGQFWSVLTGTGAATSIFLSLALFPVARHSVLFCILGIPFERMVEMHRWASRATIIAGFVHGLIHIIKNSANQNLKILATPINIAGIACFIVMVLMAILAFEPIRRKCFEVFVYPHQFLALIAVVLAMIHGKDFVNVAILMVPLLWYLIDQGVRIYFGLRPFIIQRMQALPGGVTKVTVEGKLEHEPGQYCWLMFPTISRLQYHPFSISSGAGDAKANKFTFHIKNMGPGTFTNDLNVLAPAYDRYEKDQKLVGSRQLAVVGPYGKLGLDVMDYSVLILVAGGIGVTPMASILQWMLNMSDQHKLRDTMPHLTLVVFVWSARGDQPFEHWFPELLSKAADNPFVQLVLHNTRKTKNPEEESGDVENDSDDESADKLKIHAGRPNLHKIIDSNMSRDPLIGTAVFACGPEPMIMSAQREASACGADFHKETFIF